MAELAPAQNKRCAAIAATTGKRCSAWAIRGTDKCAGHSGVGLKAAHEGNREKARRRAEARREARLSVRERAANALNEDFEAVLGALRRGLEDKSAATASRTAVAYVQLVYGRQLQQKADESPAQEGSVDVAGMTRAEREEWKRRLLAQNPGLAVLQEESGA